MRELRRLAANPELQAAWTAAAFPEVTTRSDVLSGEARAGLEQRLATGRRQLEKLNRDWTDRALAGEELNPTLWERMMGPIQAELDSIERQLEVMDAINEARQATQPPVVDTDSETIATKLQEILTDECPSDPELRLRRAAFVEAALSCVIIHDVDGSERPVTTTEAQDRDGVLAREGATARTGEFLVELRGPLVPLQIRLVEPWDPAVHAAPALLGGFGAAVEDTEHTCSEHLSTDGDREEGPTAKAQASGVADAADACSQTDCQVWTWRSTWEHRPTRLTSTTTFAPTMIS